MTADVQIRIIAIRIAALMKTQFRKPIHLYIFISNFVHLRFHVLLLMTSKI